MRPFDPLQQQSGIPVHVLLLDQKLEEGRQDGEFGLHRLLAQAIGQGAAQIPLAEKRSPLRIGQPLSPLLVEDKLRHVAIGDQLVRGGLTVVEIADHDAASEIFRADGRLAKAPVQKSGQFAAIGFVVVFAVALLQQPIDRQFVNQTGIGYIVEAEVGKVLIDLRIASFQIDKTVKQRHGWRQR